uniref:Syntaxin-16-like n=1 Tax=Phallusia mammillata TaxID=59560 RepID=A0A6F9DU16_9ASCI|nr:syntaxin-16-like [Phallusia mammillata]
MAVRSLTDAFVLMRNNAMQNKHMFINHNNITYEDDTVALVGNSSDVESAVSFKKQKPSFNDWSDTSQEINYNLSRIEEKIHELTLLHDKHLNRPTLDDNVDEEHAIEILTQEITQLFHSCNGSIKLIGRRCQKSKNQEKVILKNAMSSFASNLQDMSTNFRKCQSAYLKKLKRREERSNHFFGQTSALMVEQNEDDIDDEFFEKGFSQEQIAFVTQNAVNIDQREEEIRSVVQSITDLSNIFRDLGSIIVEQGTVLDRIDYNVEQTVVKAESGVTQLKKAEEYQKKNRKLMIIFVMAIIVIVLVIILALVKKR